MLDAQGGPQVLAVAVYNHYQRLKHEDSMAQLRRERDFANKEEGGFDEGDLEQRAPKHSDPHSTPWPPSPDALNLMNDRPVTRSLFGSNTSFEARYLLAGVGFACSVHIAWTILDLMLLAELF